MNNRYLVVHGHFYQPPRENPWIESVETQDSAAPYHDWNERITAECYARNGASRILNDRNEILRIVNNYAQISFNFGPTLLSWLEEHAELTYRSILEADRLSAERFSGHGSAMAQVYNHVILPLASARDKQIQVRWGVEDFRHRFGRRPEGMWLAETAADTPSLEALAEAGIAFTVLAPHQCSAVRALPPDDAPWHETPDASVDTRQPYQINLPSGRRIAVFFYDGPRSRAIAFERLLNSGEGFAQRMAGGFSGASPAAPELVHVATDGESYGHHHRFGEMALSYALQYIEDQKLATVTNYGEFLQRFPPRMEARLAERTSWSCVHGVERWRSNCGCNGGKEGWNQRWRGPLRDALDTVRDGVAPLAATLGGELFRDWTGAVDGYVQVVLDRSRAEAFLEAEQKKALSADEQVRALKLLELARHMQLMYTSCAWFFDDIAGIETVQVIAYATRALELAGILFGEEAAAPAAEFTSRLSQAESNQAGEGSGENIYRKRAKALQVGLTEVGAHYAISSVFQTYPERARLFAFEVVRREEQVTHSGRGRLVLGEAEVRSTLTLERRNFVYAVLHFGDQNLAAGVSGAGPATREVHARFASEARDAMLRADLPAVLHLFARELGGTTYTIRSLFHDEQRRVVNLILDHTVAEAERSLVRLYNDHAHLLQFLSQTEVPRPPALALAASFAINMALRQALESEQVSGDAIREALALAAANGVTLERAELGFVAGLRTGATLAVLAARPGSLPALERALAIAEAVRLLPFDPGIWQAQNIWYGMATGVHTEAGRTIADPVLFQALGRALGISEQLVSQTT